MSQKKRLSTRALALRLLLKIVIIIAVFAALFSFVFDITIVKGNQMYPAVRDGDFAITYRLEGYTINDVVIYQSEDGTKRLGRVAALQGSTVDINDAGAITIDGYTPSEEIFYPTIPGTSLTYPYMVPADSAFLLNDFRSMTDDSRQYGAVNKKNIHGKLIFIIRRRGF